MHTQVWARRLALLAGAAVVLMAAAQFVPAQLRADSGTDESTLLHHEDFSDGMPRWWVEGGENTWVQENSLHMRADPEDGAEGSVATAWLRMEIPAKVKVSFDAQVISSRRGVKNINVFLSYSDPEGPSLYETRGSRSSGAYHLYHALNGYIFTFLADLREETLALPEELRPARIRIRRCPGFELMAETFAYHNRPGRSYHVEIEKLNGELVFSVDGQELLRTRDEDPHQGGLLGLRTFGTYLKWSNIRISSMDGPAE